MWIRPTYNAFCITIHQGLENVETFSSRPRPRPRLFLQDQDQDHFSCPRGASRPRPRSRDYISAQMLYQCIARIQPIFLNSRLILTLLYDSLNLVINAFSLGLPGRGSGERKSRALQQLCCTHNAPVRWFSERKIVGYRRQDAMPQYIGFV